MTVKNDNDIIRMELQIGQLLRVVANINERVIELEYQLKQYERLQQLFVSERLESM